MLTEALLLIKWAVRACLLKVVTVMSSSVHVLRRWLRPGCNCPVRSSFEYWMEPDGSIGRIPRPPASHRHFLDQRRHLDSPALHPPYSPALQSASCARQGGCRCATLGDRIGQQWQVTEQPVPTTPGSSSRFGFHSPSRANYLGTWVTGVLSRAVFLRNRNAHNIGLLQTLRRFAVAET